MVPRLREACPRGGQDAGITQPRDHSLADPCTSNECVCQNLAINNLAGQKCFKFRSKNGDFSKMMFVISKQSVTPLSNSCAVKKRESDHLSSGGESRDGDDVGHLGERESSLEIEVQ